MRNYLYVVIDVADRWYEENKGIKFSNYEDTLNFLKKYQLNTLIEKLNYLEENKESFVEYKGKVELVVSYW